MQYTAEAKQIIAETVVNKLLEKKFGWLGQVLKPQALDQAEVVFTKPGLLAMEIFKFLNSMQMPQLALDVPHREEIESLALDYAERILADHHAYHNDEHQLPAGATEKQVDEWLDLIEV